MWIDAICINQGNTDERNHQVGLMSIIYAEARRVTICIIDSNSGQSEHVGPKIDFPRLFNWLKWDKAGGPSETPDPSIAASLKRLVSFRYFQRVWVIQEVALAKEVYLRVNDTGILLTQDILLRIRGSRNTSGVLNWNTSQGPGTDVFTCLRIGLECDCSDPRDRIFAVLSLMEPEVRSRIFVDYSLSTEAVYIYAVIASMLRYQSLDLLRYVRAENSPAFTQLQALVSRVCMSGKTFPRISASDTSCWTRLTDFRTSPSLPPITQAHQPSDNTLIAGAIIQLPHKQSIAKSVFPRLQVCARFIGSITPFPVCNCINGRNRRPKAQEWQWHGRIPSLCSKCFRFAQTFNTTELGLKFFANASNLEDMSD